uniref:Uncharacterized protein n=1 Tax=Coccidioides posadasii RMSCC 3488 TaxID=454284 RepID=A0A0J6FDS8_COCPO|nr:hypothetical protein CPAG_07563 [Coccidioides posadasii RMSCC 3488]
MDGCIGCYLASASPLNIPNNAVNDGKDLSIKIITADFRTFRDTAQPLPWMCFTLKTLIMHTIQSFNPSDPTVDVSYLHRFSMTRGESRRVPPGRGSIEWLRRTVRSELNPSSHLPTYALALSIRNPPKIEPRDRDQRGDSRPPLVAWPWNSFPFARYPSLLAQH